MVPTRPALKSQKSFKGLSSLRRLKRSRPIGKGRQGHRLTPFSRRKSMVSVYDRSKQQRRKTIVGLEVPILEKATTEVTQAADAAGSFKGSATSLEGVIAAFGARRKLSQRKRHEEEESMRTMRRNMKQNSTRIYIGGDSSNVPKDETAPHKDDVRSNTSHKSFKRSSSRRASLADYPRRKSASMIISAAF